MTAPLHVSQVLEQECAAFNVPVSVDEASWLLRPDYITNPAALLAKLREPTNKVSAALRSRLGGGLPVQCDAATLAALLNPLLQAPQILYDARLLEAADRLDEEWFSESQFESYRRLGLWEVETIVGAGVAADLTDLVHRAQRHVQTVP